MTAEANAVQEEIGGFLDLIYAGETGWLYLATKAPSNASQFGQYFFEWPAQRDAAIDFIVEKSTGYEVYYAPALFEEKVAKKEHVKGARVFWCEFDGHLPESLQGLPEPHVKVCSSLPGHEHWYWRVDSLVGSETLEKVNRSLTYILGADASGWDANQVLRPIQTRNHKRGGAPVSLLSLVSGALDAEVFASLPEPPPAPEVPVPSEIPAIEDVIPRYKFADEVWELFKNGLPSGDRSNALMSLGYYLAEMQLLDDEIFTLLLNADERWGKFSGRNDQYKRLMEIVVRARAKYPFINIVEDDNSFVPLGYRSLLAVEENVEWVWEGLLHRTGYMLITGPSGAGKTQFTLNALARLALGQEHLGFGAASQNEKIAFFSLEMGLVEIKQFLSTQAVGYTDEELDILESRLKIFPLGEPIYLTSEREKERIESLIEDNGFTGVVFDSLGSVTSDSLSSEENVKNLMDWNDRLRKRKNVFTWYIHHHRKASGENKKPNKLGDVYGSQYITARASTVLCLWPVNEKSLEVVPLKTRFTEKPQPFLINRSKDLHFFSKVAGITLVDATGEAEVTTEAEEIQTSAPSATTKGF